MIRRINANVYDRARGIRVAKCPHCGKDGEWELAPNQTGTLLCWNCDQIFHKSGKAYHPDNPSANDRDGAIRLVSLNTLTMESDDLRRVANTAIEHINNAIRVAKRKHK